MNFLIIGGLLAFALVAILAAVLLGMGEQRSEKARAAEQQATSTQSVMGAPTASGGPVAPVAPIAPVAPTTQTTLEQPESPLLRRTAPLSQGLRLSSESAELTQPMRPSPPSPPSPTPQPLQPARVIERDHASSALNGQVHLFAEELHSLRQQAWELEQRLQGLADMLDHMQHTQSRHLDAEEVADDSM